MFAILHTLGMLVADLFKSRCRLEAENLLLRHQLTIALRRAPPRFRLLGSDRALLAWMTRLWPSLLDAVQVVQPETILRWYRAGFRAFWRWKSRNKAGRPRIDRGLRHLIKRMSSENPLWGASRIHGELLMLGFEVAQSTVSKYMMRPSRPRSQTWKVYTLRELVNMTLQLMGKRRLLVPIPFAVAEVQARLFEFLPNPPLTTGSVDLLKTDNVVSGALPDVQELGIQPKTVEEVISTYIGPRAPGPR